MFILTKKDTNKIHQNIKNSRILNSWLLHFCEDTEIGEKEKCVYYISGDLLNKDICKSDFNIQNLKGNYHILKIENETIEIYNSLFSNLPIYYSADKTIFSNSIELIKDALDNKTTIDKQFTLENLLFNYGFSDRTLYNEIKLLPCNTFVQINNEKVYFIRHTNISDYFTNNHDKLKKTRQRLAELFIETCKNYFPREPFSITFTGGFDGRSIVACAKHSNQNFSTCSVGIRGNKDVEIPLKISNLINTKHQLYLLNENGYIENEYFKHSILINKLNPGFNGFLYAHFSYLAEQESKSSNFLLTGYCGSELFRALHISGAVTSDVLVNIFSNKTEKEIHDYIYNSYRLNAINKENFKIELETLFNEIIEYKNNQPKHLTQNQNFYVYVFEEIFRKIFGTWINTQQQFINVRTPFLDFHFIKELLNSGFAGINSDFYTHNPIKRFKGQLLYAEILRKTNEILYNQKTDKGYKPSALLNSFNSYLVIYPYFKKKFKRKISKRFLDNLAIVSGFNQNRTKLHEVSEKYNNLFNPIFLNQTINPYTAEKTRDLLLQTCSIINSLKNE